MGLHSVGLWV